MSTENEVLADITASDPGATAVPDAEIVTPVSENDPPAESPKTFSQEELDAVISKRLAREQRKWEREQQAVAAQPPVSQAELRLEQFDSAESYAQALADQRVDRMVQQREQQQQFAKIVEEYHEREDEARVKYDDFDQIAYNPKLRISETMAQAIQSSDIGPDVAYHLGTNPAEALRISRLAPVLQAKEIGKLEAKLSSAPPVAKKVTSAPAPFQPGTARGVANPSFDTTDPRSIKSMSTSEWIEADRKRMIKAWETARR
jgi:hypothetical protein